MDKGRKKELSLKEWNESERSIVSFTVTYRDGKKEEIDVSGGGTAPACMLLVECPSGVLVRGHGDDIGLADMFDVFFSRNKAVLVKMVGKQVLAEQEG